MNAAMEAPKQRAWLVIDKKGDPSLVVGVILTEASADGEHIRIRDVRKRGKFPDDRYYALEKWYAPIIS